MMEGDKEACLGTEVPFEESRKARACSLGLGPLACGSRPGVQGGQCGAADRQGPDAFPLGLQVNTVSDLWFRWRALSPDGSHRQVSLAFKH